MKNEDEVDKHAARGQLILALITHWREDEKQMKPCRFCQDFFERFRCNSPDECDCPRCSGLCECGEDVADSVLQVLRHCRDNAPGEWDLLMASESGPLICKLWDSLRPIS